MCFNISKPTKVKFYALILDVRFPERFLILSIFEFVKLMKSYTVYKSVWSLFRENTHILIHFHGGFSELLIETNN